MTSRNLTETEKLDWLRLIRSENVGPMAFHQLLHRYGKASKALEAIPELARRAGKHTIRIASAAEAKREFEALSKLGGRLVAYGEDEYPALLAEIEDAPPLLAVRGYTHVWKRKCLAIVGARNASVNGRRLARALAEELGQAGLTIVSGLARGIDTAAHQGSLATGTVAVMAGGVDVVYPTENTELLARIVESGAAVSEIRLGEAPHARHFPRRNRIVSGFSVGTLVVEAALRSGSLITARLAGDQGREVFAVPGSPLDPRSSGTNDLLRQGAVLVETARDIVEAILRLPLSEPDAKYEKNSINIYNETNIDLSKAREMILSGLTQAPTSVDEIMRECQLSAPVVLAALLELELAGSVDRYPGNRVARRY